MESTQATRQEKAALFNVVEYASLLKARPVAKEYLAENLNEACNRRGRLALKTVEASVRMRLNETECPERKAAFEDILDDINKIKGSFEPC